MRFADDNALFDLNFFFVNKNVHFRMSVSFDFIVYIFARDRFLITKIEAITDKKHSKDDDRKCSENPRNNDKADNEQAEKESHFSEDRHDVSVKSKHQDDQICWLARCLIR